MKIAHESRSYLHPYLYHIEPRLLLTLSTYKIYNIKFRDETLQVDAPKDRDNKNDEPHQWVVRLALLPTKQKHQTKFKTTSTPIFNQVFLFENVAKHALNQVNTYLLSCFPLTANYF